MSAFNTINNDIAGRIHTILVMSSMVAGENYPV